MSDAPTLERSEHDTGLILYTFTGDLDSYGTKAVNNDFALKIAGDRSKQVLVDLSGVEFVASAGLAMFIAHAQAMSRAGGKLHIINANEQAAGVFKLAGFDSVVPMYDSLDAAVDDINP